MASLATILPSTEIIIKKKTGHAGSIPSNNKRKRNLESPKKWTPQEKSDNHAYTIVNIICHYRPN
jgi:hypothetical protein